MEYALVIALTPVLLGISLLLKNRILLPLLCSVPGYLGYLFGLKSSIVSAFGAVLLWTLLQTMLVLFASFRFPNRMRQLILRSDSYSASMFRWIQTGILPEGNTLQVIRSHLQQTALYCALAVLSGNILSLIFGCILLNHMNYYVSQLARRSKQPWKAVLLGWSPWSLVRVLAFLWLGVDLGVPFASYIIRVKEDFQFLWLLPGIAGIIADLALKITISDWWRIKVGRL